MEYEMTDQLQQTKVHQAFSDDLDYLYATDTMVIGAAGLRGFRRPILIQLTKSVDAMDKIWRWMQRSGQGPVGTRLYVEMVGKVTRKMATALRAACLEIWEGNPRENRYRGITIDSDGQYFWWDPHEILREARSKRRR